MTYIIVDSGQDSTKVSAKLLSFYSYWKKKQQKYLHEKKENTFFLFKTINGSKSV